MAKKGNKNLRSNVRFSFRWRNFRSFKNTNWVDVRPITIFIGPNNSGKTNLILPLLLLKQTFESAETNLRLRTKGEFIDLGEYENIVLGNDAKKHIGFDLRFYYSLADSFFAKTYNPHKILLWFKKYENKYIDLKKSIIRNIENDDLITRNRQSRNIYSLILFDDIIFKDKKDDLLKIFLKEMEQDSPSHFLFHSGRLLRELLSSGRIKRKRSFVIPNAIAKYLRVLDIMGSEIHDLLSDLCFVGPLRHNAKRIYEKCGETPEYVGKEGEFAPEIYHLYSEKSNAFAREMNKWIRLFNFGTQIKSVAEKFDQFRLLVGEGKLVKWINYADSGFGLSQVFPFLVQSFYRDSNEIIILEQPEIHLNPRLQSTLSDLLLEAIKHKKTYIVETHSEHMLLRLRTLIAMGKADPGDIALYFVEKEGGKSSIRNIRIDSYGNIEKNAWPKGFFMDAVAQSINLAKEQLKKNAKRSGN